MGMKVEFINKLNIVIEYSYLYDELKLHLSQTPKPLSLTGLYSVLFKLESALISPDLKYESTLR